MRKVTKNGKGCSKKGWDNKKEVMNPSGTDRTGDYNAQESKPNDWRWYAQNEQLLRDSASFPYSWPLGNKLNLGPYAPEVNRGSLPGIMAIYTSPSFGWSDNANSPINVAARNIYSYVRHANSGHANYDAPDLMLYLCAMDSMYSYLAYLKRVYGVVSTYSYTNRYYPKAVVRAMGVDFDDIQANLADFRAYINSYAVKVGSMCIPASMSYMAKHMWMYSGLYTDSNQDKAQTYLFVPYGFYSYTLKDSAGALKFRGFGNMTRPNDSTGPTTFAGLRSFGNSLLDPVLMSEDMNIMSGDILKAFGSANVYKVEGINEQFTVLPAYQPEVLDQIQNATLVGEFGIDEQHRPYLMQDPTKGWLKFTPQFNHPYAFVKADEENPGQNVFCANRIVTFDRGDITPANTMEATRLTNISDEYTTDGTEWYNITTIGSEIAHAAIIWTFVEDSSNNWVLTNSQAIYSGLTHMLTIDSTNFTNQVAANLDEGNVAINKGNIKSSFSQMFMNFRDALAKDAILIQRLSQFDRHPAVAITTGIQDAGTGAYHVAPAYGRFNGLVFDVNYYTVLDKDDLKVMSETALMSMFNITQYGRKAQ